MQLRVPSNFRSTFQWLAALDDGSATKIIAGFQGASAFSRRSIVRSIADQSGQSELRIEDLFDSLLSLIRSIQEAGEDFSDEEIPSAVADDASLELDDVQRAALMGRVRDLLRCRSLAQLAKAIDLQADHGLVFRSARIFSELRPNFEPDLSELPESAALTHNLKLEVFNRTLDLETIYVAMDEEDLRKLHVAIEREIQKLDTVDAILKRAGMSRITLSEGE